MKIESAAVVWNCRDYLRLLLAVINLALCQSALAQTNPSIGGLLTTYLSEYVTIVDGRSKTYYSPFEGKPPGLVTITQSGNTFTFPQTNPINGNVSLATGTLSGNEISATSLLLDPSTTPYPLTVNQQTMSGYVIDNYVIITNISGCASNDYGYLVTVTGSGYWTGNIVPIPSRPIVRGRSGVQNVDIGASAALWVNATGSSPMSYQWTIGGVPLSGATNSSLNFTNIAPSNGGNYAVIISNTYGNVTNNFPPLIVHATVVAWGNNYYGQTNIPASSNGAIVIAAGSYFSVALKNDGTIMACGKNDYGQATGIPITQFPYENITTAVKLNGQILNRITAIAAGLGHTLALKDDGTVVAWGKNDSAQTTVPVGLNGVKAIAAGGYHSHP